MEQLLVEANEELEQRVTERTRALANTNEELHAEVDQHLKTTHELQKAYEVILGEQLNKRVFRRKMRRAGILVKSGQKRRGENRPARLYRYR